MKSLAWISFLLLLSGLIQAQEIKLLQDTSTVGGIVTLVWKPGNPTSAQSTQLQWQVCGDKGQDFQKESAIAKPDVEVIKVDPRLAYFTNDTLVILNPNSSGEISFRFFDAGLFCLTARDSFIASIAINGPALTDGDIEDIHPIETFKDDSYSGFLYWFLLALVILGLAWLLLKRRKKSKIQDSLTDEITDPGVWAKDRLTRVISLLSEGGKKEWAVNEITLVLKKFLHASYGIQAEEMTSQELIMAIQKHPLLSDQLRELSAIFEKADLYKFAKLPLSAEEVKILAMAGLEFVNQKPAAS